MNINWVLSSMLLFFYLLIGNISIMLTILMNGFMTSFTRYHILGILLYFTYIFFSFIELVWIKLLFVSIMIIKNYDFVRNGYKLLKRMLKNLIQMSKMENTLNDMNKFMINESGESTEITKLNDISTYICIKDKLDWVEMKFNNMNNKYISFKTKTNNYFNIINESVLVSDIKLLSKNINKYANYCFDYVLDNIAFVIELSSNLPFVGKIILHCKSYYNSGNKIYDACNMNDDILIDTNSPQLLENNKMIVDNLPNIFSEEQYENMVDFPDVKLTDVKSTSGKLRNNKLTNSKLPKNMGTEEMMNEMSKMLDLMENMKMPQFNLSDTNMNFPVQKSILSSINSNDFIETNNNETTDFSNIMNDISEIVKKAENINNSKIMLKKKSLKHKKRKH